MMAAYFEEWSRQPRDVARLAIGTAHEAVRASPPGQQKIAIGR